MKISHEKIGTEDALSLTLGERSRLQFVEQDAGNRVRFIVRTSEHEETSYAGEIDAEQMNALAVFLAEQFVDNPRQALGQLKGSVNFVKVALDKWNARARGDEEHPPYEDLTRELEAVLGGLRAFDALFNEDAP